MSMKMRRENISRRGVMASPIAAQSPASMRPLESAPSVLGWAARARKNADAMSSMAPRAMGSRCTPTEIPNTE